MSSSMNIRKYYVKGERGVEGDGVAGDRGGGREGNGERRGGGGRDNRAGRRGREGPTMSQLTIAIAS